MTFDCIFDNVRSMNLSGIFWNNASGAAAIMPTMVAGISSTLLYGPPSLIAPVIVGSLLYVIRNHISHSGFEMDSLSKLKPDDVENEIAYKIGLRKTPPMYSLKNGFDENAFATFNNAIMSENFFEDLNQDEQDFVWAHEFSHIRRNDNITYKAGLYGFVTSAFGFVSMMGTGVIRDTMSQGNLINEFTASLPFGLAAMVSYIPIFVRRTTKMSHLMEFDCDKRAVLATGDIDAGIRSLSKLAESKKDAPTASSSHPAINSRIGALEALKISEEDHSIFVKECLSYKGCGASTLNSNTLTFN